jgi:hypothetical protein
VCKCIIAPICSYDLSMKRSKSEIGQKLFQMVVVRGLKIQFGQDL